MKKNLKKTIWEKEGLSIGFLIILDIVSAIGKGVLFAWLSQNIVSSLIQKNYESLVKWTMCLFVNLVVCTIISFISKQVKFKINSKLVEEVEDIFIKHHENIFIWREMSNKEVLGRFNNLIPRVSEQYIGFVLDVTNYLITIVTVSIYIFNINMWLVLLSYSMVMMVILWMRKDTEKLPKLYENYFEHNRVLEGKLWEQIKNHEVAKTLNLDVVKKGYEKRNEEFIKDLKYIKQIDNKVFFAQRYGPIFLTILVALLGGVLVVYNRVQLSEVYAIVIIVPSLVGSLFVVPTLLARRKELNIAHKELDAYLHLPENSLDNKEPLDKIVSVEFKNVYFGHEKDEKYIISDISFKLTPGVWGIIGPSGCGKTTVVQLIMGLLKANRGNVYINDRDIWEYNRKDFFSKISYAPQEPVVFHDTIKWNIIQNNLYDEKHLQSILDDLGLKDWINKMENGIDTVIAPEQVSAGERQKICVARAMYREANLFVLDEATSNMDPGTENKMMDSINNYAKKGNKIVLVVTHKPQIIEKFNKILRISDGRIYEKCN